MRKTLLIALFIASLALAGCAVPTPAQNQNLNQPKVSQPIINQNANGAAANINGDKNIVEGTESFISSHSCSESQCGINDFPFCFLGEICVKPNENFRTWVEKNYVTFTDKAPCNDIKCDKCERGKLIGLKTVYHDFEILLCHECDIRGQGIGFGCVSGYQCKLGKCIKK